ncbi:MAG TPA: endonuclease/exonuclease/phosphatase family protein [Caulobacteraceae bacterium]|nr:endonuclease/exonuclease/phosphatase family protein [Caulobacteraceae bacterium]
MPRLLSYNVHRCLGLDRRLDVGRIAEVIAAAEPDVVALQEVDVGRARTGGVDQAHRIAQMLKMAFRFHPALRVEEELYGDAILTALPERLIKGGPLPGYPRIPQLEPRGALWVAIDFGGDRELQVINTHLGLVPQEGQIQARALVGPDWLGAPERRDPLILVGDLNAPRTTAIHRILRRRLKDAHALRPRGGARVATFPAPMPVLRIDHAFVSEGVKVKAVSTSMVAAARVASDHLPLIVDFELDNAASTSRASA